MICTLDGYGPCHNEEKSLRQPGMIRMRIWQTRADLFFCAHGAGFVVNWDEVKDYMHLESCLGASNGKRRMEAIEAGARSSDGQGGGSVEEMWIGTDEVDAILARTYHANKKEDGGKRR